MLLALRTWDSQKFVAYVVGDLNGSTGASIIMRKLKIVAIAVFLLMHFGAAGYLLAQTEPITRQETLRGSVTPEREWWDVLHYHLNV